MNKTIEDILSSDECNTYVMSCYLTRDDLYKALREDLHTVCEEIRRLREGAGE